MPPEFENYFCYSAMWAFGGTLVEEHRPCFSQWWREQWNDYVMLPGDEEVSSKVIFVTFQTRKILFELISCLEIAALFFLFESTKSPLFML